jgi:two-component system, NarL family, nitrate/nitrite response regulator NarL
MASEDSDLNKRPRDLSPREREVAFLVASGLSNKEVARRLGVSDGTVKIHVHNIFQKIGARNRYMLITRRLTNSAEQEA